MKWLFTPLLWLLAIVVALGVLWRLCRGKPVVLRGTWTPRFIRMVAVVLVALGLGGGQADAAPVPVGDSKGKVDDELPPGVDVEALKKWAAHCVYSNEWKAFKQQYTRLALLGREKGTIQVGSAEELVQRLPERLKATLLADLRALGGAKPAAPPTPREMLALIDEAEKNGLFDQWLVAHLWRKTADSLKGAERRDAINVMARLQRLARLADAMTVVQARIRPLMQPPVAWRGKGGFRPPVGQLPPGQLPQGQLLPGGQGIYVDPGFGSEYIVTYDFAATLQQLRAVYGKTEATTWASQAAVIVSVAKDDPPVTVIRGGQAQMPRSECYLLIGRLDLVETTPGDRPAVLRHPLLGRIEIPAGRLVTVWELPQYLTDEAKTRLKKMVEEAISGRQEATKRLEEMLPFAHGFIREGLRTAPANAGAAALRMVLTKFDDVPPPAAQPEPAPVAEPQEVVPPGGRGGRR